MTSFGRVLPLILIAACLWCCCTADRFPQQFELDLDMPPRLRWVKIYKQLFNDALMVSTTKAVVQNLLQRLAYYKCSDNCMKSLEISYRNRFPEYYEELIGILSTAPFLNLTMTQLAAMQSEYELTLMHAKGETDDGLHLPLFGPGCTSILTCDKNHHILHGRNLDWGEGSIYGKVLFRVNFTRNRRLIFQTHQIPMHLGIVSGVRHGAFSLSLNARVPTNPPSLEKFLDCMDAVPMQPIMTGYRYYFENFKTYDDFIKNSTNSPFCCDRYSIVASTDGRGGRYQHVLLTPYEQYNFNITEEELECNDNSWFVAQCNSDFDVVPSPTVDERRYAVMTELNKEQRSHASTGVGLFHAMTIEKVKNVKTVHTSIMCPVNGSIVTVAYDI